MKGGKACMERDCFLSPQWSLLTHGPAVGQQVRGSAAQGRPVHSGVEVTEAYFVTKAISPNLGNLKRKRNIIHKINHLRKYLKDNIGDPL